MKKKYPSILLLFLIICITVTYLFVKPAFRYLSGFLSKSEQVKANILLVEGWIPEYAVKLAYQEFIKNDYDYIVTTGLKSRLTHFNLSENGYLIFYPKKKLSVKPGNGSHSIDVTAYSELGGENRAHFNVYINDSLMADFLAEKSKKIFRINYNGNLSDIDSVMVQFTNDDKGDFGDRNLYVKDLIIDDTIRIPLMNSVFDAGKLDGKRRISNNYNSNAQYVRNSLIAMGLDSTKIIATSGERVRINRTLTSALAMRDWLQTTKINIKGINIFTIGTHARRTWMTYNKILNEKYHIGIISVPEHNHSRETRVLKALRETIGIIYYWIILIPY
jgi:hypothetical protein